MFHKSIRLVGGAGIILTLLAEVLSAPLVKLFAGYDAELYAMTCHGFRLYSLSFVMMGFNIWGSAFFTALNNGAASAAISFLRTLVFQIAAVLILPMLLGINGIWLSIVVAELLSLAVTFGLLMKKKTVYHYN